MNWELLPVSETLAEIRNEMDVRKAWNNILGFGQQKQSSGIWNNCKEPGLARDIFNATHYLQNCVEGFPLTKGIYLGLDTLNMDKGRGHNVEIGLHFTCSPFQTDGEWAYDCETYPEPFLIEGLYHFSEIIADKKKWGREEKEFCEYLVFLGYAGLVLREALLQLNTENDLISVWGFHDGDMFTLVQKIRNVKRVISGPYNAGND